MSADEKSLFGKMKGSVEILGDIVSPIDEECPECADDSSLYYTSFSPNLPTEQKIKTKGEEERRN